MHKCTNKKLPATFNHFFTAVAKIHSRYTRNLTKPNQYFIPFFILYELNVQLDLEAQRLGTSFLMT